MKPAASSKAGRSGPAPAVAMAACRHNIKAKRRVDAYYSSSIDVTCYSGIYYCPDDTIDIQKLVPDTTYQVYT